MVSDYRAYNFTSIGASHIKNEIVCQDSSVSIERDDCRIIAVCDGHGGADYFRSDRGSRFAAQAFADCMKDPDLLSALSYSVTQNQQDRRMEQFIKSVIVRWNMLVEQDLSDFPFTSEEMEKVSEKARIRYESGERLQSAYGTTLIGAVIADGFWFGIQIGDGKCVAVSENGEFSQPIPWDDKCFLNVTTSICDPVAASEFRYFFSRTLPVAIFAGSDGIDDCFAGDEKLNNFYRLVLKSFAESSEADACDALAEYLPKLSQDGSGDDMSVAMLLDIESIRKNAHKINIQ